MEYLSSIYKIKPGSIKEPDVYWEPMLRSSRLV
jgi:hypothetical protein